MWHYVIFDIMRFGGDAVIIHTHIGLLIVSHISLKEKKNLGKKRAFEN